jgi:hypothetical protein
MTVAYTHIEDYLELLGGHTPGTLVIVNPPEPPIINLARYDITIVESMSAHTYWGGALTDRQADLAVRLVLKYRKQFARYGIDVAPAENPQFRKPVRVVNRSKQIWLDDERIGVRFPYDLPMIKAIQEERNISQGSMKYNQEEKVWYLAITESNVNWAVTWGEINQFEIDPLVQNLFNLIMECEARPYEIKLVQTADGYEITNAADSLVEYINTKLGGFGLDNGITLIDNSGVLGYTYDDTLTRPALLDIFGSSRDIHLPMTDDAISFLFSYAELTNRYPVCIYDPTMTSIDLDLSRFNEDEIVRFDYRGKTKTCDYNIDCVKVVYAHKIPATWNYSIPLLVSTVEMMYGGKRMEWINQAEKIAYCTNTKLREND